MFNFAQNANNRAGGEKFEGGKREEEKKNKEGDWSDLRESNPRQKLGKLLFYR